jgi:hypothetical protein
VWRRDGRELYFRRGENDVMALPVQPGAALSWGRPTLLFSGPFTNLGFDYDVAPDGRILIIKDQTEPLPPLQLNVVVNWAAEMLSPAARPQ